MAPKGSKSSKKDKKHADWVEDGIQGATLVLSLVTAAAELAPVPYLKQAAGTTLKIITTVQNVREHKANFQRLAGDVAQFIAGIWKSYQEIPEAEKADWPPQELRTVIGELVLTLESISEFVEEQVRRSKAMRVLYSMADAAKIQEYRERLAAAVSQFEELDKMRSHLNINHAISQVLKNQRAMQAQLNASPAIQAHQNAIEILAKVEVNRIESTHLLESTPSVKEREEKERAQEAERRRLAEEEKTRKIEEELHRLQQMEKDRIAEERARELHRVQEMERARVADEHAKELQRLRDLEKARLAKAEQEEINRLRELEKAHKDRQQLEQLEQVRIAAEKAMEQLRLKEEAIRAAEEEEKERKRLQKVEMDRIAAEEREIERRRRNEERARIEAEEQLKRREKERIRIAEEEKEYQRKREERIREEERDRLAVQKRRKEEAARIAEAETQQQNIPRPDPTNSSKASGKMKSRVEDDEDDEETVVDVPDSEEESEESEEGSEGLSDDGAALEAARLAEEARLAELARKAADKKRKKKPKVNSAPSPAMENAFGNVNMGPPNPASVPPMFQPSPFYPHQGFSPHGTPSPYGFPYSSSPTPGMYPGYFGQPSMYTPYAPGTTITNVNSGNVSNVNISNINNNNSTKGRSKGKKNGTH